MSTFPNRVTAQRFSNSKSGDASSGLELALVAFSAGAQSHRQHDLSAAALQGIALVESSAR
ncbi:MAG: hypothetical protein R3F19_26720 [Verrucomicrobiales bacterium]